MAALGACCISCSPYSTRDSTTVDGYGGVHGLFCHGKCGYTAGNTMLVPVPPLAIAALLSGRFPPQGGGCREVMVAPLGGGGHCTTKLFHSITV